MGNSQELRERLVSPPSEGLKRAHVDVVIHTAGAARAAADFIGSGRLLLGTDHSGLSKVGDLPDRTFDSEALKRIGHGTTTDPLDISFTPTVPSGLRHA